MVLVISIVVSFWSSLTEATFLTLKPTSLAPLLRANNKNAERALKIVSDKTRLVSVTTFIDTFANIALASSAGLILSDIFGIVGWVYDTIIVSMIIMVFLYLLPKALGIENSLRMAILLSSVTAFVVKIFSPIAIPLTSMARGISQKILGSRKYRKETLVSEFEDMLVVLERSGHIEPDLARIIRNALSSSRTTAGDICTPIEEIISIPLQSKVLEAVRIMAASKHPRLPVYDNIKKDWVGAITFRSLMNAIAAGNYYSQISEYIIQPTKVETGDSIAAVAEKMENTGSTIAFVYDENNNALVGIITLSDIIENIIGIKV
jgi:CBS domain containing-hemolysin-like protein